jgi:hypothetical protein
VNIPSTTPAVDRVLALQAAIKNGNALRGSVVDPLFHTALTKAKLTLVRTEVEAKVRVCFDAVMVAEVGSKGREKTEEAFSSCYSEAILAGVNDDSLGAKPKHKPLHHLASHTITTQSVHF